MPKATETDLSRYAEDDVIRDLRGLPHRIPIVSYEWTRWNYITAIVAGEGADGTYGNPTDVEITIAASFHDEYIEKWYRPGWLNSMRAEHPFDVDGGANGRYLCKYQNGGWGVKARSWEHAARPAFDAEPHTLIQALDRFNRVGTDSVSTRWLEWKAAHPNIFGGA